jgi:beta-lactamase regulating signal transducer with metallopeptidase domain
MKIIKNIFYFYIDGFKNQSKLSRKLWLIILIKLLIMFAILKLFFFPDFLNTNFSSDEEKSNHVINVLTNKNQKNE